MNVQEACIRLGQCLTGTEARDLANLLQKGYPLSSALGQAIPKLARRTEIDELLTTIAQGNCELDRTATMVENVVLMHIIQGAHSNSYEVTPVWTAPLGLVHTGELNSVRSRLLLEAQASIMCSTFNFQRSSDLWKALEEVSKQPGLEITIYVDGYANRQEDDRDHSSAEDIARAFPQAQVFRTKVCADDDGRGKRYRNHAKFLCVDHRHLLVTSANFSYSAETLNIELGLRIDDPRIAKSIERQMHIFESKLYELVNP
ncbi:DISARM system phospholipase D-like protein DrmC [Bifidobacterium castoris]|uniref:Phospholipase n=1 Tax=Bifidobacterium castoris TaxID=2306972 RepID=A0A430F7N2_9BIFI|nr:DISARM system phospholipase D-like protein DrmC [Bifidobacterium castoris]RSX47934.1 phospholipase [Bifidobacterium castoris]